MRKYQEHSSQSNCASQYSDSCNWQIQSVQVKQLMEAKSNFANFCASLGAHSNTVLTPANLRYSKQILSGHFDSKQIANLIDRRVEKMLKNHKIKKNWCKQDCTILSWILQKLTNGKHLRTPQKIKSSCWQTVSSLIPGVNAEQCMFKWLSMKKNKLSHNKWSEHQSRILQKVAKQNGTEDWKKISRILYLQNHAQDKKYRTAKQCREQWNCYLNPVVKKGPWTAQQDYMLLKQVQRQGRRWSFICKQRMIGRTQNAVKNRYNFLIQHKKIKYPDQSQQLLLKICLSELQQSQNIAQGRKNNQAFDQVFKKQVIEFPFLNMMPLTTESLAKIEEQQTQKVTIVQCNFEQIAKFLKTNHILVPAKIQKDELIAFDGIQKPIKIKFDEFCSHHSS